MTVHDTAASLPGLCRSILQVCIGLALQSTLLLGLGLLAGWTLRSRGPALASLIYRSSLLGTLLAVLVSLCLSRVRQPLWEVSLPPAADPVSQPARLARALEAGDPDAAPVARAELPGLPPASAVLTR